jgi:hypothetical protein
MFGAGPNVFMIGGLGGFGGLLGLLPLFLLINPIRRWLANRNLGPAAARNPVQNQQHQITQYVLMFFFLAVMALSFYKAD